jgi:hypothetical protein
MTIFLNRCLVEEAKSQERQKEEKSVLSSILGTAQRKCSTAAICRALLLLARRREVGRIGLDWIGTGVPSTWPRAESELEPTGIFRGPFPFGAL